MIEQNLKMTEKSWVIQCQYDQSSILGRGTFGNVFKGKLFYEGSTDINIGIDVAIKRFEKVRITVKWDRELMPKKLSHPNVVKYYDVEILHEDFV